MKNVDLNEQEIRWLENLIINQIITVEDLIEKTRKHLEKSDKERITSTEDLRKYERKLLKDYKGLETVYNKITNHPLRCKESPYF